MEDKITKLQAEEAKLQAELDKTMERQKEMNVTYNNKAKELRQKIADVKDRVRKEQDRRIAETVRAAYGEITLEALEKLAGLMEAEAKKQDVQEAQARQEAPAPMWGMGEDGGQ